MKNENQKGGANIVISVIVVILLFLLFLLITTTTHRADESELAMGIVDDTQVSNFITHLETTNTKFYGAWWCPFCESQRDSFGREGRDLLDERVYVECAMPNREVNEICRAENENIRNYPTWKFETASGRQICTGVLSFGALAHATGYQELGLTLEDMLAYYAEKTGREIETPEKYAEFFEIDINTVTFESIIADQELTSDRCFIEERTGTEEV